MKKYGMFAFFSALMFCGICQIVEEGEGAGGGAPAATAEGDDAAAAAATAAGAGVDDIDVGGDEGNPLTPEEINDLRAYREESQRQAALDGAVSDIKTRVPGFDISKVQAGLRELHKTDPERAARYVQSAEGLELYWTHHHANIATGDPVNFGSNGGGTSFEGILEKARGGDKQSRREALSRSKG